MNIELIHQWSACQSGSATDRRGIGKSSSNSNDNNTSKPNPKPSSNARTFFQCSFEVYL